MKYLIVDSTRRTSIGTFRPGILYEVDETKPKNQAVLTSLTEGKDGRGIKVVKPVGKILSTEQAKQYREDRALAAAKEIGAESEAQAEGKGAINTENLSGLKSRLAAKEEENERLKKELQAAKDSAFDLDARANGAEAKLEEAMANLQSSDQKITGLTAQVSDLSGQLDQAVAALENANSAPPEEDKTKDDAGKGKAK